MKKTMILVFAVLLNVHQSFAETSQVKVFEGVTITTNPKVGNNSYVRWGVFPAKSAEIRKVVMHLTLAHPDDLDIAHWDYLDRIHLLRQGGTNGDTLGFELGRIITPYGGKYAKDWSYEWHVDVTDFQAFLRDSAEVEYIHSGYETKEKGWKLDLNFEIIYGSQVANFVSAQKMWNGILDYGNPENDIEQYLHPMEVKRVKNASFGRLRIQQTGHGADRPSGCSEFCSRWRELEVEGEVINHRNLWKECGNNPLYPQAGTWIYDRGNWCPGDLQTPDIIDIPLNKKKVSLDLNMEPFTANNVKQPKEQIASYFFQYEAPNHKNDVAIEEIMAPNQKVAYNRLNPRGFSPIIKIRNLGSEELTHVDIVYKSEGFEEKTFTWEGRLKFYESVTITLPGEIEAKEGTNRFTVMLNSPNGMEDEWYEDNSLQTQFQRVPEFPTTVVVDFLTNNHPSDNELFIVNSSYDTVYQKTPEMLKPQTYYRDTLRLPEGNYFLLLNDSAGNGLEFWADFEQGYGRLQLKDSLGNRLNLFNGDCGNGHFYAFETSKAVEVKKESYHSIHLFPWKTSDFVTLYPNFYAPVSLKVILSKGESYLEAHEFRNISDQGFQLDLRRYPAGKYGLKIFVNDKEYKSLSVTKE